MSEDDATIADDTELFRRIHPEQVVWDHNEGRARPTSGAFNDFEMSVNVARLSDRLCVRPRRLIDGRGRR